ncbi:hypothetical protein B7463_g1341, partial [Scytalidium lignicola]
MADSEEDTPMRSDGPSSSESGSESEEEQVEWLATAREKRSTAGNRLSALLQQEEPDDELELLFQEDEDDEGFEEEDGDQSDVQMDSSSDDEDQGPTAGADDLEGERELERQNRVARQAKKRKLQDGIPKIFRKRVKIDPTAAEAPPPRPKKKSERASWIPTAGDMPTRASARGTTKKSKEQLHAQMVHREIKRLKQLENMEKAHAAKEAAKKPPMTQADRLREAARVEKLNAKSLNRWEEAEQRREEEQRAKLEALNNRQLEGPVITWWSGLAEWVGGKLKKVGKTLIIDAPKEKVPPKKRKAAEMEEDTQAGPTTEQIPNGGAGNKDIVAGASAASDDTPNQPPIDATPTASQQVTTDKATAETSDPKPVADINSNNDLTSNDAPLKEPVQSEIGDGASESQEPRPQAASNYNAGVPLPPSTLDLPPAKDPTNPPFILAPPPGFNYTPCDLEQKPPELCVITAYPAKFRDPSTGLPYYNAYAYREIQKLKRGEFKWSKFLGAYVGMGTYAARGVPQRFLNPNAPGPVKEPSSGNADAAGSNKDVNADQNPKPDPDASKLANGNGTATPAEGS